MEDNFSTCIIGGLGHVGLPLGLCLANCGVNVTLLDIDEEKIAHVCNGNMPFLETGAEKTLKKLIGNKLNVTSNKKAILESHFVVIVIGTPVDEHLNPKFNLFKKFFDEIAEFISDDHHLILRSTVFPGTSERILNYLREAGKKTKVSFCPERISQGQAMEELFSLPQIVSSFDQESKREAAALFEKISKKIIFLDPIEAELAKIFTNAYRYILFSISNQFYQIAASNNLDFYKIYDAMTFDYPRAKTLPTPGFAAGPCLFKDTMQLAAFTNNNFFLGHSAMLVNEGLPNFLVQKIKEKNNLKEKTTGILGMAFKANNDDPRESLSFKLKKILEIESKRVYCSDIYIKGEGFLSAEELVNKVDIIVIGTPHQEYKFLKVPKEKIVIDVWNIINH